MHLIGELFVIAFWQTALKGIVSESWLGRILVGIFSGVFVLVCLLAGVNYLFLHGSLFNIPYDDHSHDTIYSIVFWTFIVAWVIGFTWLAHVVYDNQPRLVTGEEGYESEDD
jgi:hypothetical protein